MDFQTLCTKWGIKSGSAGQLLSLGAGALTGGGLGALAGYFSSSDPKKRKSRSLLGGLAGIPVGAYLGSHLGSSASQSIHSKVDPRANNEFDDPHFKLESKKKLDHYNSHQSFINYNCGRFDEKDFLHPQLSASIKRFNDQQDYYANKDDVLLKARNFNPGLVYFLKNLGNLEFGPNIKSLGQHTLRDSLDRQYDNQEETLPMYGDPVLDSPVPGVKQACRGFMKQADTPIPQNDSSRFTGSGLFDPRVESGWAYHLGGWLRGLMNSRIHDPQWSDKGPGWGALGGAVLGAPLGAMGTFIHNLFNPDDPAGYLKSTLAGGALGGAAGAASGALRQSFNNKSGSAEQTFDLENSARGADIPIDIRGEILGALSRLSMSDQETLLNMLHFSGGAAAGAIIMHFLGAKGLLPSLMGGLMGGMLSSTLFPVAPTAPEHDYYGHPYR